MAQAVADAVGATKRQVQLWTDAGVLKCVPETDRQGRGRQRLYEKEELPFAALAQFLSAYQIPIGRLQFYMDFVRKGVFTPNHQPRRLLANEEVLHLLVIKPEGGVSYVANRSPDVLRDTMAKLSGGIIVNLRQVVFPFAS